MEVKTSPESPKGSGLVRMYKVLILVSVVIRLVRAFNLDTDILGLIL